MQNKQEHLLTILSEEANEVGHICSKIQRFGFDTTHPFNGRPVNKKCLYEEMVDLLTAYAYLTEMGLTQEIRLERDAMLEIKMADKRAAIEKHMNISRKGGYLDNE